MYIILLVLHPYPHIIFIFGKAIINGKQTICRVWKIDIGIYNDIPGSCRYALPERIAFTLVLMVFRYADMRNIMLQESGPVINLTARCPVYYNNDLYLFVYAFTKRIVSRIHILLPAMWRIITR